MEEGEEEVLQLESTRLTPYLLLTKKKEAPFTGFAVVFTSTTWSSSPVLSQRASPPFVSQPQGSPSHRFPVRNLSLIP